jgi:hypothetical protein
MIPRCRWEDNVKIDLEVVGREGMDWICLVQHRVKCQAVSNTVMYLLVL